MSVRSRIPDELSLHSSKYTSSSSEDRPAAMAQAEAFVVAPHPYYPEDVHIAGYVPNTSSLTELVVQAASILVVTIFTAGGLAKWFNPRLTVADSLVLNWFVLCECPAPLLLKNK